MTAASVLAVSSCGNSHLAAAPMGKTKKYSEAGPGTRTSTINGRVLAQLRDDAGLTQESLAAKTDRSVRSIARLESSSAARVFRDFRVNAAAALNMPLVDFDEAVAVETIPLGHFIQERLPATGYYDGAALAAKAGVDVNKIDALFESESDEELNLTSLEKNRIAAALSFWVEGWPGLLTAWRENKPLTLLAPETITQNRRRALKPAAPADATPAGVHSDRLADIDKLIDQAKNVMDLPADKATKAKMFKDMLAALMDLREAVK